MRMILISGQQGSGKTTLAERLWDHFHDGKNGGAVKLKFADPLYAAQEAIRECLAEWKITFPEKDGKLLQLLGTEWGRGLDENIWVKALQTQISFYEKVAPNSTFIVDDCRFKNEFFGFPEALRVRLRADEEVRCGRTKSWRANTEHPSETDLLEVEKEFELIIDTGKSSKDETFKAVLERFEMKFSESLDE